MTTADEFNRQMRDVAAQFVNWARDFEEHAQFIADNAAGYWLLTGRPRLANACAFEFAVHPQARADYYIGGESYEERPLDAPEALLPLARAIAAGSVIRRQVLSANTGLLLSTQTIITLADGTPWRDEHKGPLAPADAALSKWSVVYQDQAFVPFKR